MFMQTARLRVRNVAREEEALDSETSSHLDPAIKIIKFGKFPGGTMSLRGLV